MSFGLSPLLRPITTHALVQTPFGPLPPAFVSPSLARRFAASFLPSSWSSSPPAGPPASAGAGGDAPGATPVGAQWPHSEALTPATTAAAAGAGAASASHGLPPHSLLRAARGGASAAKSVTFASDARDARRGGGGALLLLPSATGRLLGSAAAAADGSPDLTEPAPPGPLHELQLTAAWQGGAEEAAAADDSAAGEGGDPSFGAGSRYAATSPGARANLRDMEGPVRRSAAAASSAHASAAHPSPSSRRSPAAAPRSQGRGQSGVGGAGHAVEAALARTPAGELRSIYRQPPPRRRNMCQRVCAYLAGWW